MSKGEQLKASTASTEGRLVYAVGDIHGRLDLLDRLLLMVADDVEALKPSHRPVIVFVGDYVDRGSASRGVISRLIALRRTGAIEVRTLKGNHEQVLLQFLSDPMKGAEWVSYGGGATLASYGVTPPAPDANEEEWALASWELAERLSEAHLAFLQELELAIVYGDYLFVHAGVRPGIPLAEQRETDLLWIRDDFLSAPGPFEKIVVHGHTPKEAAFIGPHRIGLDTGGCMTGVLTAVRLGAGPPALLQTVAAPLGRAKPPATPPPDALSRLRHAVTDAVAAQSMVAAARKAGGAEVTPKGSEIGDLLRPEVMRSAALVALLALSFAVLIYSFAVN